MYLNTYLDVCTLGMYLNPNTLFGKAEMMRRKHISSTRGCRLEKSSMIDISLRQPFMFPQIDSDYNGWPQAKNVHSFTN